MILIKVSIIQKRKKQIFSSMEIWGIEEIKRERERRGVLPQELYRITLNPRHETRVPNKVDSTGKLNVCHGLIERKNRCVGRQTAEKSFAKLFAIHGLCRGL